MIKLVSYAYMLSFNTTLKLDYCEEKDLQSPYVTKINDAAKQDDKYVPVYTCDLNDKVVKDSAALLQCIKSDKIWLKI